MVLYSLNKTPAKKNGSCWGFCSQFPWQAEFFNMNEIGLRKSCSGPRTVICLSYVCFGSCFVKQKTSVSLIASAKDSGLGFHLVTTHNTLEQWTLLGALCCELSALC